MVPRSEPGLEAYERWWREDGGPISAALDRAGTPWLQMFDRDGTRIDHVEFIAGYESLLRRGYREGVVSRAISEGSLVPGYRIGYVTSFFDPGLYCPYTVSLATAVTLDKYATAELQGRYLSPFLNPAERAWQGATWMTEVTGGSDLGAAVATTARPVGDLWELTGDKYFASNVGADVAVVAARPEGAPRTVRGLALFLVPRLRPDGALNYTVRRLKDKIATRSVPTGEVELRQARGWLLGALESGIYLILEVLNVSRVANSVAAVALTQRALSEAVAYGRARHAFGKPIIQHPLLAHQVDERYRDLQAASALAWKAVRLLDEVWRERPPYSDRYHLFRLVAHLAKYWTAEIAVQTAKWAMEVHGGIGTLAEFGVDRWLREAMILAIWEGTPHRQILDGLEVMERKGAHELLFAELGPRLEKDEVSVLRSRLAKLLTAESDVRERQSETVFRELAQAAARAASNEGSGS